MSARGEVAWVSVGLDDYQTEEVTPERWLDEYVGSNPLALREFATAVAAAGVLAGDHWSRPQAWLNSYTRVQHEVFGDGRLVLVVPIENLTYHLADRIDMLASEHAQLAHEARSNTAAEYQHELGSQRSRLVDELNQSAAAIVSAFGGSGVTPPKPVALPSVAAPAYAARAGAPGMGLGG